MEELCTCKCHMSDICVMELFHEEYNGDIPLMMTYCRYQFNFNNNIIHSTFHNNSAGDNGGALYL